MKHAKAPCWVLAARGGAACRCNQRQKRQTGAERPQERAPLHSVRICC
jgi:hypothetical protein